MEQRFFILMILTGFLDPALSVPQRYKLIQSPKTWADPQTYCKTKYIDLATIESAANLTNLQTEAQKYLFSSPAWIGLYKPWRWSMSNEILGDRAFWVPNDPIGRGTTIDCAIISSYFKGWISIPCNNYYSYVCYEVNNPITSRYIYYSPTKTWYDALSDCRQFHTDLANPTTYAEHTAVKSLVPDTAWIGLIKDIWRWTDNTSAPIVGWASGQPDNAQKDENCAYISNNVLADDQCNKLMPFFCNSVLPNEQQIVRLNVQSDQDMTNPAAESQILGQIQSSLKAHGMVNITVKFKKLPDGIVFHKVGKP